VAGPDVAGPELAAPPPDEPGAADVAPPAAELVAAGADDELADDDDEEDDDEFVVACPGALEHAANISPDAATRAVSVTARVLVMKVPPRKRHLIRQRRPPSTNAFCGPGSNRVVSDRQTLRTVPPSGLGDNSDRDQRVTDG